MVEGEKAVELLTQGFVGVIGGQTQRRRFWGRGCIWSESVSGHDERTVQRARSEARKVGRKIVHRTAARAQECEMRCRFLWDMKRNRWWRAVDEIEAVHACPPPTRLCRAPSPAGVGGGVLLLGYFACQMRTCAEEWKLYERPLAGERGS